MKLAWLTDIHLNFLNSEEKQFFYQKIVNTQCEAVLISGDIAEAPNIKAILEELANFIVKPIYFVLGNHDYYRGQINAVRSEMTELTESNHYLFWLPACGSKKLDHHTCLLGQDGWADGRLGNYTDSRVTLNDSRLIYDLFHEKILGRSHLLAKMQQLADDDAKKLQEQLLQAVMEKPKEIIVLTHVPPFKEACLYEGKISNDDWLPYFSSKATGDVLISICATFPEIDFLVLCGHTHGQATFSPCANLTVEAGHAEYYQPEIQKILTFQPG